MVRATGVSHATVQRIWDSHGLQPQRVKTFTRSTAPAFVDKLVPCPVVLQPRRRVTRCGA